MPQKREISRYGLSETSGPQWRPMTANGVPEAPPAEPAEAGERWWANGIEAADILGVHPETVRRMANRGDLPFVILGSRRVFRRADLEAIVKGRRP